MKGDFSHWQFDPNDNFSGVLQQQGKVLLDRDWNAQMRIAKHWQDTAGRDAIGPNVAAVPIASPDGFKVEAAAKVSSGGVDAIQLTLDPGRAWADGILCYLPPDPANPTDPVTRTATYLQPPVQDPAADLSTLAAGVRDCVVLEVSRQALNGFQAPDQLIEPALGGPDTTERVLTTTAFRLWRLADDEDCHTIHGKLQDDRSKLGRLTAQLQPTTTVPGDCPVVEGGGYTGFEHNLYRIEIADLASGGPKFKWSQWNGGLVGAGLFNAGGSPVTVTITANLPAILHSGLKDFYLEALVNDAALGGWRVACGVQVTLNNDQELEFAGSPVFGDVPTGSDPVFFRLWNGLEDVADYTDATTPVELKDGIQLVFDAPGAGVVYRPGDYWTFPVRAGGIANPVGPLVDAQPPEGILYHRVPLAVVTWGASLDTTIDGSIEDCRRRIRPLSQLDTCCTFRVGDGDTSLGDFDSIQAAIDALPDEGGEVCVLPGTYVENVEIINRQNVTVSGCGPRTVIKSPDLSGTENYGDPAPVIHVIGGSEITLESFAVEAADNATGVLIEGANYLYKGQEQIADGPVFNATVRDLQVTAALKSAVRAEFVQGLVVSGCTLLTQDETNDEHTLAVLADDVLIERNTILVTTREQLLLSTGTSAFEPGSYALGGLQLEGLCERVRVVNNDIRGGSGHGITLGSLLTVDANGTPVPGDGVTVVLDPCSPTQPAGVIIDYVDEGTTGDSSTRTASGGALYDVTIERNRIRDMGVCGIGVVGFFDLSQADQFITVSGLRILGNEITGNLRRTLSAIPAAQQNWMGYGGVSLADVEDLVIRDNEISANGTDAYEPVCGVFVLHAEGVELARNRIRENGGKVPDPNTTTGATSPKTGHRGGIVIIYALAPATEGLINATNVALGTGAAAVRIEGNTVTTPLGPAVWLRALGPVAVLGNSFASRGIVQSGASTTVLGAVVAIENLGMSDELYLAFLSYAAIASGSASLTVLPSGAPGALVAAPKSGLDDSGLGRLLTNGKVQFAQNQVSLTLLETGATLTFAAVAIMTLDDLSFHGNQCDCDLLDDFVYANAMLFGFSVRAHDNRFTEGLLNGIFSAVVLGLIASASGNQSTHCLLVKGYLPTLTIKAPNSILMNAILPQYCDYLTKIAESFGGIVSH